MTPDNPVRWDRDGRRFEMDVEGGTVFARYYDQGDILAIVHTETPRLLRGRGYAGQLVKGMLALIRADGKRVRPQCPFVAAYIRDHPEERDLLA